MTMVNDKKMNYCIKCTVSQCANHSCADNFCALDSIMVVSHEPNPSVPECTDCQSFVLKK